MNPTRITLAVASSVLLFATLTACGGSSDGTQASDQSGSQTEQSGQQPQGGAGGFPGASGLVAAVSGTTAQVQNAQSGQVAVSWTSDTTFTQQVDAALSDVTTGACVMVTSADADSGSDTQATEVTAASVRILPASDDGSCGFGGGGGLPNGRDMPSGAPTDMPTDGAQGGRPGGGFGTIGEVTAVSGDGFTVAAAGGPAASDASTDVTVTVTVSGDTTFTTAGEATASAVKTGVCVSAQGDTDDTGALTATTISVTKAVDGACTGGFGGGMPSGTGGQPGAAS